LRRVFAGGREIRISSLELAKLYSSRAYLKPSTGTGVLDQEFGDGAMVFEGADGRFPGGHNISTLGGLVSFPGGISI
jgi:hypothetical protein